ncbi:MAG: hypothetical protein IKI98_05140 [Spirochaetaceae bacterium]|nr:hypothetical protein [Spirochaetaceae bacterium]
MKKKMTFERRVYFSGILPNALSAIFIYLYSTFIMQVDSSVMLQCLGVFLLLFFPAQFLVAPLTNKLITRSITARILKFEKEELSSDEKFTLFKDIQSFPRLKQLETMAFFFVATIIVTFVYNFYVKISFFTNLVNACACFFGTYISGIMGLLFSVKICSEYAAKIVSTGIDDEKVQAKKTFGVTFNQTFLTFIVIPAICTTLIFIFTFLVNFLDTGSRINIKELFRIAIILLINIIVTVVLTLVFFKNISDANKKVQYSMEHIIKNDIFTVKLMATDISNEVSYNMYLINRVIQLFRSVFYSVKEIGSNIIDPVQDLTEISNETASTAYEQAAGVKEILATMEDNDAQTREILGRISEVTDIARKTTTNVEIGFETLRSNLEKMNEITEANISTITGIKVLSEKIESIWEIVNIIKDISDQTRIIAFNAELEASGAGEAGKKFHIVANEVRRLAAGITNSVVQIRERITEIQHSSDNLIITSESGTEKIREGCELTTNLESKFSEIKTSSEITAESAIEIQSIIQQQSSAFDQIVATIREIATGIENFSASTNTVNTATDRLKNAADKLENLHKEVIQG